jgi:SynChlorMet cassette radical SAM/SPASM protein ScmE
MGKSSDGSGEMEISIEEINQTMDTMVRLQRNYGNRILAVVGPLANALHWLEIEKARKEGRDSLPGCGFLSSCGGATFKIAVRADGIIVPCMKMGHMALGRINHCSLRTVWQEHPDLIRLRRRRNIPLSAFSLCEDCQYIPYCRGNCPALVYSLVGEVNHPSPDACLKLFLDSGGRLPEVPAMEEVETGNSDPVRVSQLS